MLERALRYGRQLFKRAPKVVIPEDPTSKPNLILKLMGFYNKDSVLPRQAKKLYTAAKEQVSINSLFHFGEPDMLPFPFTLRACTLIFTVMLELIVDFQSSFRFSLYMFG